MAMEITKALCLSTMHISQETARWLDERHKTYSSPFSIWEGEHGYFIPAYPAARDEINKDIPADLMRVMCHAVMHECSFVRLDSDGPVEEGIETYEW